MKVTLITGEEWDLHPAKPTHLYIDPRPDLPEEMANGIFVQRRVGEYPATFGRILDLPADETKIQRCFSVTLERGDLVSFLRYATEELLTYVEWQDKEVVDWTATYAGKTREEATTIEKIFVIKELHVIDVEDIEGIFK